MKFEKRFKILKADEDLSLVFGWTIVCKEDGEDYYDLQGDHIPEATMLKAAADFMESARTAKTMHTGGGTGTVLFAWPLTADIGKACGVTTAKTGLLVGIRADEAMMKRFRDGELTGFSIGGVRGIDEEAEDAA